MLMIHTCATFVNMTPGKHKLQTQQLDRNEQQQHEMEVAGLHFLCTYSADVPAEPKA